MTGSDELLWVQGITKGERRITSISEIEPMFKTISFEYAIICLGHMMPCFTEKIMLPQQAVATLNHGPFIKVMIDDWLQTYM